MKKIIISLSEYFSDSDQKSIRRLLAFQFSQVCIFIGLLMSIRNGWVNMEGAAHVLNNFLVLIGGLLGLTTMQKLPSVISFINTIRKKKPDPPTPAPNPTVEPVNPGTVEPTPTNGEDEELKDVDPEEVKPQPEPVPQPVTPAPAPAEPAKLKGRNKELFIRTYYPYAVESQQKTGISADFIIAQKGLETGWKLDPPGWNFGGIKAPRNAPAESKQLLVTHEVLDNPNASFPQVLSVTKVGKKQYRYKVKDYFRKYSSPAEAFEDHAQFFFKNKRYAKALQVRNDANAFADAIAKAGYATDPAYAAKVKKVIAEVQKVVRNV